MKKIMILVCAVLFLCFGCAGMNASVPVNITSDIAFVEVLRNNPTYKPAVVAGLQSIKTILAGDITYDDLIIKISQTFTGRYAYIGVILTGYIDTDKPVSETYLNLFNAYKVDLVKKIDRLIILASM